MSTIKLLAASIAVAAFAVPSTGQAASTTYSAPWDAVHQDGDSFNLMEGDTETGDAQILRLNIGAPSGGLGCTAEGGYVEFEERLELSGPGATISAAYTDALVGPYAFIKIALRQDGEGVNSTIIRGPLQGDGVIDVAAQWADGSALTGPVDVWFGLETSSSCLLMPEVAKATFPTLTVSTPDEG